MVCRPSCGPCVGDVPRFACGRAGVEEIMGFAGSLGGRRGVVWVCFWVPGPPPATFGRVRFSGCPWRDAVGLVGRGPGLVGVRGGLRTG